MDQVTCPKCGSTNVLKQAGYASVMHEGQSAGTGHVVPNQCREENCRHEWYNKE